MLVKSTFRGVGMGKYIALSIIVKIILIVAFIMSSIENGTNIIDHIQAFANTNIELDLYYIVKQIGWVFGKFVLAVIIEVVIMFAIIFPIANAELKRGW